MIIFRGMKFIDSDDHTESKWFRGDSNARLIEKGRNNCDGIADARNNNTVNVSIPNDRQVDGKENNHL